MNLIPVNQSELIQLIQKNHHYAEVSNLSDFSSQYAEQDGIWLRGETKSSVKNCLFCDMVNPYQENYEYGIRTDFIDWLQSIGWHLECYDYGSYVLTKFDSGVV